MRILILCKNYVDIVGGVEYVTQYLSEQYSLKKHDVHVFAHLNNDTVFHPDYYGGANIHYISTPHCLLKLKGFILGKIISSLHFSFKSYGLIHRLKPDVIHVQHTEQSIEAFLARIIDNIPYCIAFHGEWENGILFPKFLSRIWKYYPNIRFASCITALTEIRANEIKEGLAYQPLIIPNGVDSKLFYPNSIQTNVSFKPLKLITVSRLTNVKRINDVIIALSKAIVVNKNIHLTVVGDGEEADSLKQLVAELNLEGNVLFTGFITQEEKIKHLQDSHIFLIPSLYEGFPLTILEAFATSLPVIATPVSSVSELVIPDKTGFVVPFCSPESISDTLIKIINLTSDEYNQMRENCRNLAEQYDWGKVAEEYERIYSNMLIKR